ncbi:MAG: hypothetical protein AAFX93_08130 [Verrucomicrobiota bacterium]
MSQLESSANAPVRPQNDWPDWTVDSAGDRQRYISVPLGLAITILFHLGTVWLFPWDEIGVIEKERPPPNPPLEVEFIPPPEVRPEFIEANPLVPEQKPEDADKIAAQDAVAAQEEPDPLSDSDEPMVEGELLESQKIVTGDLTAQPTPPSPPVLSEPSPPEPPSESQEQAEPTETPPDEQQLAEEAAEPVDNPTDVVADAEESQFLDADVSDETPGVEAIKAIEVDEAPTEEEGFLAAEKVGEAPVVVEETTEQTAQPEKATSDRLEVVMEEVTLPEQVQALPSSEPRPQARPTLNFVRATSGPLKNNPRSTSRMGATQVDANFDKFGAYLQRMVEAVDLQWQLLARQSSTIMSEMGSRVIISYNINQKGEITRMEVLFSSASRSGTAMCLNAIESRAPFGVWTEEMVKTLGEEETIKFTFYYR